MKSFTFFIVVVLSRELFSIKFHCSLSNQRETLRNMRRSFKKHSIFISTHRKRENIRIWDEKLENIQTFTLTHNFHSHKIAQNTRKNAMKFFFISLRHPSSTLAIKCLFFSWFLPSTGVSFFYNNHHDVFLLSPSSRRLIIRNERRWRKLRKNNNFFMHAKTTIKTWII